MNGPLTALASKEFRALLPVWAAAAFTIGADTGLRGTGMHSLFPLGMFAYIAGSLALGAHVIGHEFTNRTLASLLVQPCRRSSMLLTKASVLAVMLVALGFIARVVLFQSLARSVRQLSAIPHAVPAIDRRLLCRAVSDDAAAESDGGRGVHGVHSRDDVRPRAAGRHHHLRHRNGCRQGAGPRRLDTGDVDLRRGRGRPVCAIVHASAGH